MHEMLCQGQEWSSHKNCTQRSVQQSLEIGVELDMPATCCLCFCQGLCQFRMTHQICAAVMLCCAAMQESITHSPAMQQGNDASKHDFSDLIVARYLAASTASAGYCEVPVIRKSRVLSDARAQPLPKDMLKSQLSMLDSTSVEA